MKADNEFVGEDYGDVSATIPRPSEDYGDVSATIPRPSGDYYIVALPKIIWIWDFLGDGSLVLHLNGEVSWFKRVTTRFFFGSKWKRSE